MVAPPLPPPATVFAAGPAGVPQWWQNLEPEVSGCPQEAQGALLRGAPHSVQKRPLPGAEQRGHTDAGGVGCD